MTRPGNVPRLCSGGRCAQVLEVFARWREEKRVEWAREAARQHVLLLDAAASDARLSQDDRVRLLDALADRMDRVAAGDDRWLIGEAGELWVGVVAPRTVFDRSA